MRFRFLFTYLEYFYVTFYSFMNYSTIISGCLISCLVIKALILNLNPNYTSDKNVI